jgi:hypothetical protein
MTQQAVQKIEILLEGFGYDHKDLGKRTFLNTFNGLFGAQAGAEILSAYVHAHPEFMGELDPDQKAALTGGIIGSSAIGGSHALGKLDKALFKAAKLDKKEDFKS